MRLLLVNSALPELWGGGEMWFTEAAKWFRARGHVVRVVGRPGSRLLAAVAEAGVDHEAYGFGGDYDPIATARALGIQLRFRPDIVLVNFNKEAWLFGRGARLRFRPLVARHGLTLFKDKRVHRILYRLHMDHVIVNAPSIREDYARRGLDTRKVSVILNGVRPISQRPGVLRGEMGIGPGTLLVGAAGRLGSQKRLDRFVRIAGTLARSGMDVRFVLFGDGDQKTELERQVESEGLGERFVFGGFRPDYAAIAGDLDLFLLTSDNEGTPNVLLETMAAGTASIAFDVGSVGEILIGSCGGGLVEAGDTETMAELAATLLHNPGLREELAIAQSARVRDELSLEASMSRYEETLESLLRGAKKHPAS